MGSRRPSLPDAPAFRSRPVEAHAPALADSLDGWALERERAFAIVDDDEAHHARLLAREIRRAAALLKQGREEGDVDSIEVGLDVLSELASLARGVFGDEVRLDEEPSTTKLSFDDASAAPAEVSSGGAMPAANSALQLARLRLRRTMRKMAAVRPEAHEVYAAPAAPMNSAAKQRMALIPREDETEASSSEDELPSESPSQASPMQPAASVDARADERQADTEDAIGKRDEGSCPQPGDGRAGLRRTPSERAWSARFVDERNDEQPDAKLRVDISPRERR